MVCSYQRYGAGPRASTMRYAPHPPQTAAQARIEGREPFDWGDDDYAVVDDTVIGRIYREMIHGEPKCSGSCSKSPR